MAYSAARPPADHGTSDAPLHAFVLLLREISEADQLASLIKKLRVPDSVVVTPPVRGLMFFADPSPVLDAWWGDAVPRHAEPVYILGDEPGMIQWINNVVDGHFVVGVHEPADVPAFTGVDRARAVVIADLADYAIAVAHDFGGVAASQASAALYGDPHQESPRQKSRRAARFRRARLDSKTELMVAVPNKARAVAPRQMVVSVNDPHNGSEAFFHPTVRPAVIHGGTRADSETQGSAAVRAS